MQPRLENLIRKWNQIPRITRVGVLNEVRVEVRELADGHDHGSMDDEEKEDAETLDVLYEILTAMGEGGD